MTLKPFSFACCPSSRIAGFDRKERLISGSLYAKAMSSSACLILQPNLIIELQVRIVCSVGGKWAIDVNPVVYMHQLSSESEL